jgi:glutamate/tyrosine decarboxylase-like PLP-dependent enzyme
LSGRRGTALVPLKPGNYRLTAEHLDKYVDENTIAVVAIAGQTFTGEDDDIREIHDWLDAYEKKAVASPRGLRALCISSPLIVRGLTRWNASSR